MGHVKAALEDAETAVRLRPDWAKGHLRKASAHRLLGNHIEAFKVRVQYNMHCDLKSAKKCKFK